jgi:hypothetical protein
MIIKLSYGLLFLLWMTNAFSEGVPTFKAVESLSPPHKTFRDLKDQGLPRITKPRYQILRDYYKVQKKFFRSHCTPGTEENFWKLYKAFKGTGHFVPLQLNGELDTATIQRFLPEIESKLQWINKQKEFLGTQKNFKIALGLIQEIEDYGHNLLSYKEKYDEGTQEEKLRSLKFSQKSLEGLKLKLQELLEVIPFLKSYKFPVDHFDLRLTYDLHKNLETKKGKKKSNEVFFYRKVVEDGSQNKNHKRSDLFLRANLDTLYLELEKTQEQILPENLRYDLRDAIARLRRELKRGINNQVERMNEWSKRTTEAIHFYKNIVADELKDKEEKSDTKNILLAKSKAKFKLRQYVLKKQSKVYEFWSKEREILKILFVLDTILTNEVGGLDGRDALERKDVTQVVINRYFTSFYSTISSDDPLMSHLSENSKKIALKNDWLNVLFKEGEFSFTYYFISSNLRIFCPSMTRRSKFLRKENLKLGLNAIMHPRFGFNALRYFSRASMLGRINMAQIWDDFIPLPERVGNKVSELRLLRQLYKKGAYTYLYRFTDSLGRNFRVLDINNTIALMDSHEGTFFRYRNPNYFRYFKPITEELID